MCENDECKNLFNVVEEDGMNLKKGCDLENCSCIDSWENYDEGENDIDFVVFSLICIFILVENEKESFCL